MELEFTLSKSEEDLIISILNNYFINVYELLYNLDQKQADAFK